MKTPIYPALDSTVTKILPHWLCLLKENPLKYVQSEIPHIESFIKNSSIGDFPDGPVTKTLHSQCRGPRFNPWSRN